MVLIKRIDTMSRKLQWVFIVSLLGFIGCGAGSSDQLKLGKVTGTVTLDGKPLADADVSFQPANGRASVGTTDETGAYDLVYLNDVKGATIGANQVMISTKKSPEDDNDKSGGTPERLPKKYHSQTTLSADVKAGENVFDFSLDSK